MKSTGTVKRYLLQALLLPLALGLWRCSESDRPEPATPGHTEQFGMETASLLNNVQQARIRELSADYLRQAQQDYSEADQAIASLRQAIDALLANSSEANLDAARQAWLTAHSAYERRLLHQYHAGQFASAELSLQLQALDYSINHWPILPGYVDSVPDFAGSGIVNDMTVLLTAESLRQIHGQFDLSEAALGFHVLEFLLWGADPTQPRSASAFAASNNLSQQQLEDGLSREQLPNNRRRRYLKLLVDILYADFQQNRELFSQAMVQRQAALADVSPTLLLSQALGAVTSLLSEEFLVRSLYPLLNGDYHDSIHAPYSRSSQNVVVSQLASIEELLLGEPGFEDRSLDTLLVQLSADFEALFYPNLAASKECLVLLYSDIQAPQSPEAAMAAEFEIVECINLLTNLIEHLQQIQQNLGALSRA
ncbi:MAG: hypothetical protein MRY76_11100 [Pseudomonadales bacterium]|nr:hypothetical protein [Pseudomonadales bacterium]